MHLKSEFCGNAIDTHMIRVCNFDEGCTLVVLHIQEEILAINYTERIHFIWNHQ